MSVSDVAKLKEKKIIEHLFVVRAQMEVEDIYFC